MPKKLTHEEFLENLKNKNEHYRSGDFKVVGTYIGAKENIRVETKWGICELQATNLLSGVNPCVQSAVDKTDFVQKQLLDRNLSFRNGGFILKETVKNIRDKIIVEDCYGEMSVTLDSLLQGNIPSIESAVDKNSYFLNRLRCKNPLIYEKITSMEKILKIRIPVRVFTKHGSLIITPRNLEKLTVITSRSMEHPSNYFLNMFKEVRSDFNNIDYSDFYVDSSDEKSHFKCKIHNLNYYQRREHHLNCRQGCNVCLERPITYTREYMEQNKQLDCILYVVNLQSTTENFYKVGITTQTVDKRLKEIGKLYDITVLYEQKSNLLDCYEQEQKILKEFYQYKIYPKNYFGGYTECLTVNPIEWYYN